MRISKHTFLVTGGSSGLGAATARMLVQEGASVVIADISPPSGENSSDLGTSVFYVHTDVTSEPSCVQAFATVKAELGELHGLVNCAGVAPSERLFGKQGPHSLQSFERTIAINLIGTFNMLRLGAAAMSGNEPGEDGERGVIVNTASIAAFEGQVGQAAYAASKAGIVGLTLPAARELARFGIRVVTIAPGVFTTPMMSGFSQEVQNSLAESVPFPQRLGKPEEFARLVKTITEVTMLNGEVIRLDGALRMAPR